MKSVQKRLTVEEISKVNELQKLANDNCINCKVWKMYDAFFEQARFSHAGWTYQKQYAWSLVQAREAVEIKIKYLKGA